MPLRVDLLPERNVLRLTLRPGPLAPARTAPATIDVGEQGVLIGVEVVADAPLAAPWRDADPAAGPSWDGGSRTLYLPVGAAVGRNARSVGITVDLLPGADGALAAVDVPRRGAGYEITYPSGNQ